MIHAFALCLSKVLILDDDVRYVCIKILEVGLGVAVLRTNSRLQPLRLRSVLEPTHSTLGAPDLIDRREAINLNNGKRRVKLASLWRCGRVAEGAPLLREYRVCSPIEGSNPSVSAS